MITADQAIATAQQWEAEKAAGPSALVGRALLAYINSLASLAGQEVIRALEEAAVICDQTYVEPGDIKIENCHEAAAKIRSLKIEKARLASPQVTDEQIKDALRKIDQLATNYDQYECGLPLWKEEEEAKCVGIIRALLSAPPAAEAPTKGFCRELDGSLTPRPADTHTVGANRPFEIASLVDRSTPLVYSNGVAAAPQEAKPVAADGWQVVPKVPTLTMLKAMDKALSQDDDGESFEECYAAAYSAALAVAAQEQAPADKGAIDADRWRHCVEYGMPHLMNSGWFVPFGSPHGAVYCNRDLEIAIDTAREKAAALQSQPQQVAKGGDE